jgi:hypothetical protein
MPAAPDQVQPYVSESSSMLMRLTRTGIHESSQRQRCADLYARNSSSKQRCNEIGRISPEARSLRIPVLRSTAPYPRETTSPCPWIHA